MEMSKLTAFIVEEYGRVMAGVEILEDSRLMIVAGHEKCYKLISLGICPDKVVELYDKCFEFNVGSEKRPESGLEVRHKYRGRDSLSGNIGNAESGF